MTSPTNGAARHGLPWRLARRSWRIAAFIGFFTWEFIKSNALVLQEILRPRGRATPAILQLTLRSRRHVQIVSLANLISLTPGTLAIEVSLEPPTIYVHGMFAADPDAFIAGLHDLERRLLNAMQPVGQAPVDTDAQPGVVQ